ncbi:hypothetical protein Tco_0964052 [Tanacetum coccineum]
MEILLLILLNLPHQKTKQNVGNDITVFPTTSWRISIRSMDSFQGLTPKSPSSWHRPLAPNLALYDNNSWNDPRDFAKPVKQALSPQLLPKIDQDSAHMVATSKVRMLKPAKYELWMMRMEHCIQMIDYSLWEVIGNGNAPPITKVVEGVETTIAPTTAEEKA